MFILLGVFALTFGSFISSKLKYLEVIFGIIIITLGLNYAGILKLNFLNNSKGIKYKPENINFIKAVFFGIIFSISYTPCVGTFLSSALLLIASGNNLLEGILLMLVFSLGLGIPFIISAIFIQKLKTVFDFIKRNYKTVKIISGLILIAMGIYIIFF